MEEPDRRVSPVLLDQVDEMVPQGRRENQV